MPGTLVRALVNLDIAASEGRWRSNRCSGNAEGVCAAVGAVIHHAHAEADSAHIAQTRRAAKVSAAPVNGENPDFCLLQGDAGGNTVIRE